MGKMEEGNKLFVIATTQKLHIFYCRSEEKTDKSGTNFLCRTSSEVRWGSKLNVTIAT